MTSVETTSVTVDCRGDGDSSSVSRSSSETGNAVTDLPLMDTFSTSEDEAAFDRNVPDLGLLTAEGGPINLV